MVKINLVGSYPDTDPAAGDRLVGTDISDTGNDANGETVTFSVQRVANWNEIEDVTGTTYTLVLADRAMTKTLSNATSCAVTIPTNASVAFPIGSAIVLRVTGAGTISDYTITAAATVSLDGVATGSCAASAAIKAIVLTKVGTNSWYVDGQVGAVA